MIYTNFAEYFWTSLFDHTYIRFAFENWRKGCLFNLAHELKRT